MNSDLYTDEYRNFRFLKSSTAAVDFYKKSEQKINSVQDTQEQDPNFRWECRLEFLEQLLDLRNDTVYIVESGILTIVPPDAYRYEDARMIEIIKPVIYSGNLLVPKSGKIATLDDIPTIENRGSNAFYYFCSEKYIEGNLGQVFKFKGNPLIPSPDIFYSAMFYNKEWASRYRVSLTKFLRQSADVNSAIKRLLI